MTTEQLLALFANEPATEPITELAVGSTQPDPKGVRSGDIVLTGSFVMETVRFGRDAEGLPCFKIGIDPWWRMRANSGWWP